MKEWKNIRLWRTTADLIRELAHDQRTSQAALVHRLVSDEARRVLSEGGASDAERRIAELLEEETGR